MRKNGIFFLFPLVSLLTLPFCSITTYADSVSTSFRDIEIVTNERENWPEGPIVDAESAILMEANTGAILYEKNIHKRMYPASTTKMLTTLICMEQENVSLSDMVYFSNEAVSSIPRDASNMGMDIGEAMTLEECLYGVLVVSANEVANAVAEYTSGDLETFVNLMNERAKELGCVDSHFANAHGYSDPDHYTSCYDLALICKEFSKNELLSKISRTPRYHWYPTDTQPDDIVLGSTNYFMKGYFDCDGIVCTKTGYTDESGQVLVSCFERNGMKLICVVMNEVTPKQYEDTLSLIDYGFENFDLASVIDYETKYIVTDNNFFHSNNDILGDSKNLIFLDKSSKILIPKTTDFNELDSTLDYINSGDAFAKINYSYSGGYLGSALLMLDEKNETAFVFDEDLPENQVEDDNTIIIYFNYFIYAVIALFLLIIIITIIVRLFKTNHIIERHKARSRWKRR